MSHGTNDSLFGENVNKDFHVFKNIVRCFDFHNFEVFIQFYRGLTLELGRGVYLFQFSLYKVDLSLYVGTALPRGPVDGFENWVSTSFSSHFIIYPRD